MVDILVYQIKTTDKIKIPYIPIRIKRHITYELRYRIDEDRMWYSKRIGRKITDQHHTKNNLINSIRIMEGIQRRLAFFNNEEPEYYDVREKQEELFVKLINVSKNIEKKDSQQTKELYGLLL